MTERRILVFQVGERDYGADVREVREVIPRPDVTGLPRAKPPVVGVFNLRGRIVTAVDGGVALGVREPGMSPGPRAVVAEVDGHHLGILVDSATEVLAIEEKDVREAPGARQGPDDPTRGVVLRGPRPIVLLNLRAFVPAPVAAGVPEAPREVGAE